MQLVQVGLAPARAQVSPAQGQPAVPVQPAAVQPVLPLVSRVASSVANWLEDFTGEHLDLRPDLDQVPALSVERDAVWKRVGEASFLSDPEKRALLGLPVLEVGDGR